MRHARVCPTAMYVRCAHAHTHALPPIFPTRSQVFLAPHAAVRTGRHVLCRPQACEPRARLRSRSPCVPLLAVTQQPCACGCQPDNRVSPGGQWQVTKCATVDAQVTRCVTGDAHIPLGRSEDSPGCLLQLLPAPAWLATDGSARTWEVVAMRNRGRWPACPPSCWQQRELVRGH